MLVFARKLSTAIKLTTFILLSQALTQGGGAAPKSNIVTVNGAKLEYLDWGGRGAPLVFIAGLGDTPYVYNDLAPEFTSRYHCLGLTRRGFGRSEQTAEGYELDNLVGDIAGFLAAMNLKDVTMVGHSFGAIEVMRTTELHRDLVRRVVLLDPAFTAPDSVARSQAKVLAALGMSPAQRQASMDSYRQYRKFMLRAWSDAAEANLKAQMVVNADGTVRPKTPASINEAISKDRLKGKWQITSVTVPALFILAHNHLTDFAKDAKLDQETLAEVKRATAEADVIDKARTEQLRHDSPQARVVELDHTDHHCFIQRRTQVLAEMQRFLP